MQKKDEIFSMANMGQDIKEAMTNGSVAVVGNNMILKENIVLIKLIMIKQILLIRVKSF